MRSLRHSVLALLVLLQLLVPYLHSHASPGVTTGLHVHLPSLGIAAVGEAPDEPAAVLPRLASPAGPDILGPVGDSPALEMPVEWRRDQQLIVVLDAACPVMRAPPLGAVEIVPHCHGVAAPVARVRFTLMAYPAAAPPAGSLPS